MRSAYKIIELNSRHKPRQLVIGLGIKRIKELCERKKAVDYITQVQVRRFPSSLSRDYVALLEGAYGIERSIVTIVSFFF